MSQTRSWEELSAGSRSQVPVRFDLGWDCCGRHTSGSERLALYFEDKIGEIAVWREGDPVAFLEYWHAKFSAGRGGTGDLTTRDDEGFYWYRGRTDDVIKSADYRIGPAEIEDCLLKYPAIANAAVIGLPNPRCTDRRQRTV
jgi:acyl-coenzyme A synthetase/AMP-(fatty) acid ligase